MEGIELICFEIISSVGMARGSFIEAIDLAEEGKFAEAEAKITEGEEFFKGGHSAHAKLIQNEAGGNKTEIILLLLHAEDQLMSAETFKILAEKFISLNKKIEAK
ncbi:MAG: PTS lactose/cellobiose transporter subunit IIA [Longicatena sp.]|uniref:PTS lactose/cellobiose transporter subunit IIA n=1 Tax=Anaerorhabdus sp. TaxID=1872524 RepID=UPI002FC8A95E